MFCQSCAFPTEKRQKKTDFVRDFLISEKKALKKARCSKSGFKKAKLATLLCAAYQLS